MIQKTNNCLHFMDRQMLKCDDKYENICMVYMYEATDFLFSIIPSVTIATYVSIPHFNTKTCNIKR